MARPDHYPVHFEEEDMFWIPRTTMFFALFIFAGTTQHTAYGQHVFRLVELRTDDVLAYLELSTLPATEVSDVVGLSFTASGDAIYGFGEGDYPGAFDQIGTSINSTDDGLLSLDVSPEGVLSNSEIGLLIDWDAPAIGVLAGATAPVVTLSFGFTFSDIRYVNLDDATQRGPTTRGTGVGRWILVPEPSSWCCLLMAILIKAGLRKQQ